MGNVTWLSGVALFSLLIFGAVVAGGAEPKADQEPDLITRLTKAGFANKPFTIIVEIHVKSENVKTIEELIAKAVAGTHKEPGNIMYDCHKASESANTYYFLERFKNVKAMEEHVVQPHTKPLLEKFGTDLVSPPKITILDKISGERK
jgi:quinol monooxygenase YgiN